MAWLPAHDGILAERVQFEISDLGFEIGFRPISDPLLTLDASSILMPSQRRGILELNQPASSTVPGANRSSIANGLSRIFCSVAYCIIVSIIRRFRPTPYGSGSAPVISMTRL